MYVQGIEDLLKFVTITKFPFFFRRGSNTVYVFFIDDVVQEV